MTDELNWTDHLSDLMIAVPEAGQLRRVHSFTGRSGASSLPSPAP